MPPLRGERGPCSPATSLVRHGLACRLLFTARSRASGCCTDDERPRKRGSLRQLPVGDARDAESGSLDSIESRSVAVAVDNELIQPVQSVLPACEPILLRAHVLDEQQLAPGLYHAVKLSERARLAFDRAEHECGDTAVERFVLEREMLGRRTHDLDGSVLCLDVAPEATDHRL